jgi:GNAT superfamily N-acetyltransferase
MTGITVELAPPTAAAFADFRQTCGWGTISPSVADAALRGSVVDVSCLSKGALIGFGRVVGDGVLYHYLQDIIVHPDWRGKGVGRLIVEALLDEVRLIAPKGATIGLMSANGKDAFYEKFGFERRPTGQLGAGMTQFVL